MIIPRKIALFSFLIAVIFGCSVVQTDNNEKALRDFLTKFEADLNKHPEEIIKTYFTATNQPKDNILQVLRVLQNQDTLNITSVANFQTPSILRYETRSQVTIPVTFSITENGNVITKESVLVFWMVYRRDAFQIEELDATKFYQGYTWITTEKLYAEERKQELKKRAPIYATADSLQQVVDSVIWYATYNDELFFYAVSGSWKNIFEGTEENPTEDYAMGLLNAKGDTLIPFEYDMIGTIGFVRPGMIEIKKDGKYGYYNIDSGTVVVRPVFDMIIPYTAEDSIWALTVTDSTYGWITTAYEYIEGTRSDEAVMFIEDYKYLANTVVLKAGNQIFCEIPNAEHAGFGIIIPPSYYVENKLFATLVGGINTTKVPMNGWTDSIEKNSMFNRIGDNIRALITILGERYIGGRDAFYGSSKVSFVNEADEVMATTEMPTDQEIVFSHVDNFTIELKATAPGYHYYPPGNELDIPVYKYFRLNKENQLEELASTRIFPFTEFVKIDSSYLEGTFSRYVETVYEEPEPTYEESEESESDGESEGTSDEEQGDSEVSEEVEEYHEYEDPGEDVYESLYFLSLPTIELMRDEILAVYGVRSENMTNATRLESDGYVNLNASRSDAEKKFNEIDRHNLDFLERVIALLIEEQESQDSAI